MKQDKFVYDAEELALLDEIEKGEWQDAPFTQKEKEQYAQSAAYTKSLQEKRQTTIRSSQSAIWPSSKPKPKRWV